MKVVDLELLIHERPSPLHAARTSPFVVATVKTDEGIDGTVFVSGPGPAASINAQLLRDVVRPMLIGRDPLDIATLWGELWRVRRQIGIGLVGAIDVALWDILARSAGLPLHRVLGTARARLPVYVSSWVHRRIDDYVDEALHYRSQGIGAYKMHPPTARRDMFGEDVPIDDDIEAARAVREAVGPSMVLMSDSPRVYSFEEALKVGRALEELDFHWYEDPLPADDVYGYTRLRERLRIPIIATEMTDGGPYAYPPWLLHRATDYLRGDVHYKGGVSALMKIAHTAEVFRLNVEVHDGFNATGNLAGLNVAMAVPNTSFFEMLTIQPTGQYGFANMSYGLLDEFTVDATGHIAAPTAPGLGARVDWELIRSRGVAVG